MLRVGKASRVLGPVRAGCGVPEPLLDEPTELEAKPLALREGAPGIVAGFEEERDRLAELVLAAKAKHLLHDTPRVEHRWCRCTRLAFLARWRGWLDLFAWPAHHGPGRNRLGRSAVRPPKLDAAFGDGEIAAL